MRSGFEEKQFESIAQSELQNSSQSRVRFYPPGQVLEGLLGFDLGAYLPKDSTLWATIGTMYAVGLTRSHWAANIPPGSPMPDRSLNVFFQYKTAEYLSGTKASFYEEFGGPYFRFGIDRELNKRGGSQHSNLLALDSAPSSLALVRYVAPRFSKYSSLSTHSNNGRVLEKSIFVRPRDFEPDHKRCVYDAPPTLVKMNPDGSNAIGESWSTTLSHVAEQVSNGPEFAEGIVKLASVIPGRFDPPTTTELRPEVVQSALKIMSFAFRSGLNWSISVGA